MNINVVPPKNWYDSPGFCKTPLTNMSNTASKSISEERSCVLSTSKLSNSPLKNNGNLTLLPSCKNFILSIASISPNCQDENLSLNISKTSNSNSCIGADKWAAVTRPTGLNLSPFLNEYPSLAISNSLIVNNVEPIPTEVVAPLTATFNNKLAPVSSVGPTPNLDIPTTSRFSYTGSGTIICGFIYPEPGFAIVNASDPPTPTVAVTSAPVPPPPPAPTLTVIELVVTDVIVKKTLFAGSVARGYGWLLKWLSLSQVNTNELVAIFILLLVVKPCSGIINTNSPVDDSYITSVGVNVELLFSTLIELLDELTNLCKKLISVTPIATVPPR